MPQSPLTLLADPTVLDLNATSVLSTTGGNGLGVVSYQLVSGPCSLSDSTLTGLSAGSCVVTATKAADASYAQVIANPVILTISLAPQSSLTVVASPTTIDIDATSALSVAGGNGTGAVTYQLLSGPCSLSGSTLTGLGAGSCVVTATKAEDTTYAAVTSQPTTVTVKLAPQSTLTLLASSLNPSTVGASVTFTATVQAADAGSSFTGVLRGLVGALGGGAPTGTVEFFDGATSLGTGTLDGAGQTTLATSALTQGTHSVSAVYAGNASYQTSTSTALSQVVNVAPVTYTVTYNGNGNTGGAPPTDASSPYTSGAPVTVLGNTGSLVKAGSSFTGWNTAANGSGTTYAPAATFAINADTTLFAQWSAAPAITPATQTVRGQVGTAITATTAYTATGFTGAVSYAISPTLPAGLSLNATTGVISGTPTATQTTATFTVTATGATSGTATATVSITILATQATGTTPGGPVTASITGGTCLGYQNGSAQFTVPAGAPVGETFPYGVFGFTALNCGAGGTVTITLTYPAALPTGTKYWKNINGTWVDWTSKVTITGNTVVLTITDGGAGDTNPNAGQISDPSGPAFAGGPTPIPTLSEWGLILLGLALLAVVGWRQRQGYSQRG